MHPINCISIYIITTSISILQIVTSNKPYDPTGQLSSCLVKHLPCNNLKAIRVQLGVVLASCNSFTDLKWEIHLLYGLPVHGKIEVLTYICDGLGMQKENCFAWIRNIPTFQKPTSLFDSWSEENLNWCKHKGNMISILF